MNVKQENIQANKIKLTIELTPEEFEEGMKSAYQKVGKRVNIPGFRKGKAPRKVIENYYGESIFYEEAFNYSFPKAYEKAVEDNNLFPVEQPQVDVVSIGNGEPVVFTAEFFVKPEVELGQYKGIEVEKPSYSITQDQIDARLASDRERSARWVDAERPAQIGDRATIDYAGSVDGVPFEGGTAEGYPLELGSNSFIPGFEEQVVGMVKDEEKDIEVTFPEKYHSEELAGKQAVFHVKVRGIQFKELPELDDEFAKDVSEFDTLADYKADIEKKLSEQAKNREENELVNAIIDKICQNAACDIPQPMIKSEVNVMIQDMAQRFAQQGLRFDDYLKYTGMTIEQVRGQYQDTAQKRVKSELVLEAIRKAENLEATEEDMEEVVRRYSEQAGCTVEEFKSDFDQCNWDYIKNEATAHKTIEFLKSQAVLTEKKAEEPEQKTEHAEE